MPINGRPGSGWGGEGSGVGSNNFVPPSNGSPTVEEGYEKQKLEWDAKKDEAARKLADAANKEYLSKQEKPKFVVGDIVKINISKKSSEAYNDRLFGLKRRIPKNKTWLDYAFDGAIGEVESMVPNEDTWNLNPEYKYLVKVYRLSGTSKYNPELIKGIAQPPTPEYIFERDMEKVELPEEALNIAKNAWNTVKFDYSPDNKLANWMAGGGKRRSKSAKRVKTAKRAKSRKIRRRHK